MSSPVNNFLSLIPTSHKTAIITAISTGSEEETILPAVQKTRRSSSSATTDSNTVEEPSLPEEPLVVDETVASPIEIVNDQLLEPASADVVQPTGELRRFLKLGN